MDEDLLKILVCPESKQKLRLAEAAELEALNRQIESGGLENRDHQKVSEKLEAALIREDGKYLYPVRDGIPVLLIAEGIPKP